MKINLRKLISLFGFTPATSLVDYITVNCTAVGSGSTTMNYITGTTPGTLLASAGFNVTGTLYPIEINITPVTADCPALEANIGDSCDDEDATTENDVITSDCECVGTIIYDCPALSANINDTCDDGEAATENDVITSDCECAGVPQVAASILGSVFWNGSCGSRPANIKLYDTSTDSIIGEYNTTVNENGEFNVSITQVGDFNIVFKVSGYLSVAKTNYTILAGSNTLIFGALYLGDVNNNNMVNMADLSSVNSNFQTSIGDPNFNPIADFNCDGKINILDISMLNTTFGMVGEIQPNN